MCLTRVALFVRPLMLSSLPQHLWQCPWLRDGCRRPSSTSRVPLRTDSSISPSTQDPRRLRLLFPQQFSTTQSQRYPGGLCMCSFPRRFVFVLWPFLLSSLAISLHAQSATGTITGTVADASGAVVPGATVTIENPVSGLSRTTKTDASGQYRFTNLPFNPYHLSAHAEGFSPFTADVPVRSSVAVTPIIKLEVGGASTTVTVTEI